MTQERVRGRARECEKERERGAKQSERKKNQSKNRFYSRKIYDAWPEFLYFSTYM